MACTSHQILKKNVVGGACSKYEGEESCIQDFAGKPEGRRPLGRSRRRWEENIKMDLLEVEWGRWAWIGLIWLRIGTGGGLL
jgi:hypothetical protein